MLYRYASLSPYLEPAPTTRANTFNATSIENESLRKMGIMIARPSVRQQQNGLSTSSRSSPQPSTPGLLSAMARKARSIAPAPASPQASRKSKTEPPASSSRPRNVSSKPTSDPFTSSPTAFISLFPLLQILVLGALVRLVLFTRIPKAILDVLVHRNELSSPLTSWRRLKEGVFLLGKGVDPYNGGLVLLVRSLLPNCSRVSRIGLTYVFWIIVVATVSASASSVSCSPPTHVGRADGPRLDAC